MRDNLRRRDDTHLLVIGAAACGVVLLVLSLGIDRVNFDAVAGALTAIVLVLAFVPLIKWVARKEGDPWLGRILLWALFAKFAFTMVRYFVIERIYGGNADAGTYDYGGQYLADLYLQGIFTTDIPLLASRGPETVRISVIVAVIYLVTGFSVYAAFFVFSSICFWGQVLMLRAFRRAVPDGDHRHYTVLVMFLPSMLFWPSSIGKEAVMIGCIGLVSYGAANILGDQARVRGFLIFAAGTGALFLIRPHMGMIAIVSLGIASAVGVLAGFRRYNSTRAFAVRIGALILLIAAASLATTQLSRFFDEGGAASDESGLTAVLDKTRNMTSTGGSEFTPVAVSNPLDLPAGAMTVLFRPFPWEARSVNGLITAAEGLLLLGLFVAGWRRLITWARTVPKRPYLVFAFTFAMVFVVAFSYVSNFGILARQRTQMLPLVLTLLAMYPAARRRTSMFGGRPVPTDGTKSANPDERTEPVDNVEQDGCTDGRHVLPLGSGRGN